MIGCISTKKKQISRIAIVITILVFTCLGYSIQAGARTDDQFMVTKKAEINIQKFLTDKKVDMSKPESYSKEIADAFQKAFDSVKNDYELKSGEYVQINVPAGTYYINKRLKIRSNTYLKLDSNAVIKNLNRSPSGPMLANYYTNSADTKYKGYDGASNIVIDGGTWDGNVGSQNDIDSGFSNMIFVHAKNIVIKNLTVKSNFQGHLIELAGVQNGHILNCTLQDYITKTETASSNKDKEAIQLDITHDDTMVPTMGGYDDTVCKDIVIKGNRIENFSRGIGSHAAVRGIYNQNITIEGNTFVNVANEGILAYNYRKVNITGNTFNNVGTSIKILNKTGSVEASYKETLSGVSTTYPSNYEISITNNTINSTKTGSTAEITLEDKKEKVLGNTVISGNTISTAKNAISICGTKSTNVSGNNITKATKGIIIQNGNGDSITSNSIANCSAGAIMNDAKSTNLSIKQNSISGGSYGIRLYNTQNSTVEGNQVNSTGNTGIYLYNNCSGISVSGNSVSKSGSYGILLNNTVSNSNVANNSVKYSAKKGITVCTNSNNNQVVNNDIGYNKTNGIDVNDKCTNVNITGNKVYNNGQIGVYVNSNVSGVNIESNTVYMNKQNGIGLKSNCSNSTIKLNTVHKNGKIGISINSKCNNIVVTSNSINSSGSNGIGVSDYSTNTTITSNKVGSNKKHGISIYNNSNNISVTSNNIFRNRQYGVSVSTKSVKAKVQKNTLSNNTKSAIYVKSSDSATIKNNQLKNNKTTPIMVKSSKKCSVGTFSTPKVNGVKKSTKKLKVSTAKTNKVIAYVGKKKLKVTNVKKIDKKTKKKKATGDFTAPLSKLKKNNKISIYVSDKGSNKVTISKTVK
ncbi:cell surface protein [Lachnospiraceae bacterium KM106-2]|nr:cell surface protein [Lachnospiraceae bacterium KM106-2]